MKLLERIVPKQVRRDPEEAKKWLRYFKLSVLPFIFIVSIMITLAILALLQLIPVYIIGIFGFVYLASTLWFCLGIYLMKTLELDQDYRYREELVDEYMLFHDGPEVLAEFRKAVEEGKIS